MEKTIKNTESSLMYRKIDRLGLTELERSRVISALESSNRLADAVYWVIKKLGKISSGLSSPPKLKHQ
jgi:hypothetical protein